MKMKSLKQLWKNERGEEVTANGFYNRGSGEIWVDINSGANANGLIMNAVAHELTHLIEDFSPASFRTLAQFLAQEYNEQGLSVDEAVKAQIALAKKNGLTLTYRDAYGEFVAESMTALFNDGQLFDKVMRLANKDIKLTQKMEKEFGRITERLRKAYANVLPDSDLGKMFLSLKDKFEKLQSIFADALVAASKEVKNGFYIATIDMNKESSAMNKDGTELFEIRAIKQDENIYRQMLYKWGGMKPSEINALFDTIGKAAELIQQNTDILDFAYGEGGDFKKDTRAFTPVKKNSDPLYKVTISICETGK